MQDKSNTKKSNPQMPAGILKEDGNVEFFGVRETREVKWIQHGKIRPFSELKGKLSFLIVSAFEGDQPAKEILKNLTDANGELLKLPYLRRLELYVYYCWGSLNSFPDVVGDVLSAPENFREKADCISLGFSLKKLTIDGIPLKPREIVMIDLFAKDYKDEIIAKELGIAMPTFNQHKRSLFDKAGGVMTKTALMIKAVKQQLLS